MDIRARLLGRADSSSDGDEVTDADVEDAGYFKAKTDGGLISFVFPPKFEVFISTAQCFRQRKKYGFFRTSFSIFRL